MTKKIKKTYRAACTTKAGKRGIVTSDKKKYGKFIGEAAYERGKDDKVL